MLGKPVSRPELPQSRSQIAVHKATAPELTLIRVTWDSSPDPGEFMHFITAYTRGRFSAGLAERVTLASTELLDNALRYGSLARDFSYSLKIDDAKVTVSVQNTTVRTRVDMLTAQLRRVDESPEQVYASELERSLSAGSGRRSMLGLARIRHEAEMRVEVHVNDNEVNVCAYCAR